MKPTLKNIIIFFFLVAICTSGFNSFCQEAGEIDQLTDKIKSAQNVDELYSIRYNLDKYIKRSNLTIDEQKKLNRAFIMLSAAFKSKSHFKNAADVYKDYLTHQEKYLNNLSVFIQDSIKASQNKLNQEEIAKLNSLEAEIQQLNKTRDAVAGLKSKYYSFGTIAAIAIVVIFLIIFITRNRAIRLTTNQLKLNQSKLLETNPDVLKAKMLKGSIKYGERMLLENIESIESILTGITVAEEKKALTKVTASLEKAKAVFAKIKS